MVLRPLAAAVTAMGALMACTNSLKTKEKVQEAVIQRLRSSSGLDLASLDVSTTDLTFDKNLAYATVAFHPKGDPSVASGMTMKYTLELRGGQWSVIKVGDSRGHAMGMSPGQGTSLPAGHPPVDGAASGAAPSGAGAPSGRPQ